jgi:serine/threonine-protein kinase
VNAAQYARVKELFAAALVRPEPQRAEWLNQQCSGDELIRLEVLSLLRHHRDDTVLESLPAAPLQPAIVVNSPATDNSLLVLRDIWEHNRQVLRRRLMIIASLMAVFVVISMLRLFTNQQAAFGYGIRLAALIISVVCAGLLYRKSNLTLWQLRVAELVVMGNVGLLAAILYMRVMHAAAERQDYLALISINNWNYFIWTLLIFVYGVFMPNTWQRAAAILLPVAMIPTLLVELAELLQPAIVSLLAHDQYGRPFPAPLIAAGVAIYAAHLIHGARLSAFGAKRLAQYQLKRLIGEGGMGQVFEAEHLHLQRPCAIKLIQPERAQDDNALQTFELEVRATARLTHPHTIQVYDYGQTREGMFFYAMELLPGMNLRDLVRNYGPLPPARAWHFLADVCDALHEAHEAGLIHRDIKPSNIFASQRGGIEDFTKLLDFGLVRQAKLDLSRTAASGLIAGSPRYMSPEQVTTPANLDARTDIYSLGAVGYFMLTGRPPLSADSALETMLAQVHEQPQPPSAYRLGIPADLAQVIMRCLVKELPLRTPTARQLRSELDHCQCAGQWTQQAAKQWWQAHFSPWQNSSN